MVAIVISLWLSSSRIAASINSAWSFFVAMCRSDKAGEAPQKDDAYPETEREPRTDARRRRRDGHAIPNIDVSGDQLLEGEHVDCCKHQERHLDAEIGDGEIDQRFRDVKK